MSPTADDILSRAHVVALPMAVRFRGITVREALLIDVPVGHHATITNVGCPTARRLRELGLRAGANVTVLQKTAGGGRVIKVRGSHYALGAETLRLIAATPAEQAA
mgnify:FL=1